MIFPERDIHADFRSLSPEIYRPGKIVPTSFQAPDNIPLGTIQPRRLGVDPSCRLNLYASRAAGEAKLRQEIGRLLNQCADSRLEEDLTGNLGNYPGLASFLGKLLDRTAEPDTPAGRNCDGAGQERAHPRQTTAAARQLESHPALRDRHHPEHKAVVEKRLAFLAQTGGR